MEKSTFSEEKLDEYMDICISLAKCSPFPIGRPYVGAIIIDEKDNIVGRGFKTYVPATRMILHAERNAIYNSGIPPSSDRSRRRYTLITTMEPCLRTRKTQIFCSCSEFILQHPISTVIFGDMDKASFTEGEPSSFLRSRGIKVIPHLSLSDKIKNQLINPLYGYDRGTVYTPARTLYKMSLDDPEENLVEDNTSF